MVSPSATQPGKWGDQARTHFGSFSEPSTTLDLYTRKTSNHDRIREALDGRNSGNAVAS
ncbi:MAG: hypothetical protein ACT4NY_23820 [Pseudonocardiales bacterium]